MGIYDRKNKGEQDAQKSDDPGKLTAEGVPGEPKIETDEKKGPDLAALNANGPGTEEAKQEALKRAGVGGTADEEGDYVVAEGRSLTSKRGILGPGATVSERDFSGGQGALDEHVKGGTLVRKGQTRTESDKTREPDKT
jgi:hypothetical protein